MENNKEIVVKKEICNQEIQFKTGVLAKQANGAVLASLGGTQVLAIATMGAKPSGKDFLPLSIDYTERFYSTGRIPGSYKRREGRPSDHEVLVARLIDRPLRPLFPKGFRNEVQIIIMVLSVDGVHPSDVLSAMAASCALGISDIPVSTMISGVRVGLVDEKIVINPNIKAMEKSKMNLLVMGSEHALTMIEGEADMVSEEIILDGLEQAQAHISKGIALQKELVSQAGKKKKEVPLFAYQEEFQALLREKYYAKVAEFIEIPAKKDREHALEELVDTATEELAKAGSSSESLGHISGIFNVFQSEIVRKIILEEDRRNDKRAMDELRPISCSCGYLNNAHGSALFTRGETQSLGVVALGGVRDQQRVDLTSGMVNKAFYLHYNFPPFSVGEIGRYGFTGRREIGHGMLAERSLAAVLPKEEDLDCTIRLVSEILESNGSSSMASICSGSMALMDAGIPLSEHVAGVSLGLVMSGDKSNYRILTDIQGLEDQLGDMDLKIAGTKDGITGFQMDIKIEGITLEIMQKAFTQAKKARLEILEKMNAVISKPKPMSEFMPRREQLQIRVEKIKMLIGTGGKNIKRIVELTGSDIDIAEDGTVKVFSQNSKVMEETKRLIELTVGLPRVGAVYEGKVKRIAPFGLFVEIMPGLDGLCHISKLAKHRINDIHKEFHEGQMLKVHVDKVDDQGKIFLNHAAVQGDEEIVAVGF